MSSLWSMPGSLAPKAVMSGAAAVAAGARAMVAGAVPPSATNAARDFSQVARGLGAAAERPVSIAARRAGWVTNRLARSFGVSGRQVWSRPGRHHIEVRHLGRPGGERLARRVEETLSALPGVDWARVNAPSGRVVVSVSEAAPSLDSLIAAVAKVERTGEPETDEQSPHPPAEGPKTRRSLSALAADGAGLGLSVLTRALPFTPAPGELAALTNMIDLHPRLHDWFGRGLRGRARADATLPMVEALVQGLTGGYAGIALDTVQRIVQWDEARAELSAWSAAEEKLTGTPENAAAAPLTIERPRPRPDGPLERYAHRVLTTGAAAGAASWPFAGFKRAASLAVASLPKAAAAGNEGYAAHLGRVLARRGVIAMDRGVLRELHRIDTLLLDESALLADRAMLTDLQPLPDVDAEAVTVQVFTMFDPDDPAAVRRDADWVLGPLDRLDLVGRTGARAARRLAEGGGDVLGLAQGRRLMAVIKAEREPARGVDALTTAARRAGLRLVVTGAGQRNGFADATALGGENLLASVRQLQSDGAMVMVVSADQRALAGSDCGIGVCREDGLPPWGAHLLVQADLEGAALVVDATGVARDVVGQSIQLAGAGTALGAITAFTSPVGRLPARPTASVNTAAAIALANGLWHAHQLHDRAPPSPPTATTPWHLMPGPIVLDRLRSSMDGLSSTEADKRGGIATEAVTGVGLARAFAEELANPLTPVLGAGAGLSAAVGSAVDAGLVGGVVGLSALVGAVQRVTTERSLATLLSRSAVAARVRRDGVERVMPADQLVPGDIVLVAPGDVIPADCRVLEAAGLEADESSLTGESLPVAKTSAPVVATSVAERRSILYEGTTAAAGRGVAVVVATGADTEAGRSMALARQAPPATGVETRLAGLSRTAVPLAAGSAVAVIGAGVLRGVALPETVSAAANLAVASVPEGLPFLVSAAQMAAARRLAEHGALVRNPRTIEALGRVDVLCFDKTGTLTEGRLRLAGVGDGDQYAGPDALDEGLRTVLVAALRATPPAGPAETLDHQTDRAVLDGAGRVNVTTDDGPPWRRVAALPFEPSRGYHATVGEVSGAHVLSVKGAPEVIVARCVSRRRGSTGGSGSSQPGEACDLDDTGRAWLQGLLERHAGAGHRLLAVAERRLSGPDVTTEDVDDLTFLGFVTLADEVRDSAAPAVRRIRAAGVHTIMLTGDHPATAEAIASVIDADAPGQQVVTATELDDLDDDALAQLLAGTDVVARCTPTHKVRIIQTLQRAGRTVAMTGDGANDAPAIRLADIGIALGHRGAPAARAAADLVVTDDRLETIIAALIEGRAMWSSVRQAMSTLIGGNLGEIVFSVLSAAVTGRSALGARQLLLVNLLTDLAPALAIATRPPHTDAADTLLTEGPDTSLGQALTNEIALRAAATAFGATAGWSAARLSGRGRRASTIALASLVGTQLGQTLLAGGMNPRVVASTAGSAAVLAVAIQTPGVSRFFGCTPLGPLGWSIAASASAAGTLANAALGRRLPNA